MYSSNLPRAHVCTLTEDTYNQWTERNVLVQSLTLKEPRALHKLYIPTQNLEAYPNKYPNLDSKLSAPFTVRFSQPIAILGSSAQADQHPQVEHWYQGIVPS